MERGRRERGGATIALHRADGRVGVDVSLRDGLSIRYGEDEPAQRALSKRVGS